jgi:ubiquinone biosynthesis protein Coq4
MASITLAEGLEEFRAGNPALLKEDELSSAAAELFHCHDLVHVVFGCDTRLEQEAMADVWTIFGTDVGFKGYVSYLRLPEARQAILQPGLVNTLKATARVSPRLVRVARCGRAMKKKWPFRGADAYLHRPLRAIRDEFGIRLV